MTNPAPVFKPDMNSIRKEEEPPLIQSFDGLVYFSCMDHYGSVLKQLGSTDTDLPAAASMLYLEGQRLGELLGIGQLRYMEFSDPRHLVSISEYQSDIKLIVAKRGSDLSKLRLETRNIMNT